MKKKLLIILFLSLILILFIILDRTGKNQSFASVFSEMVNATDRALVEFSEIDERYIRGEETNKNYENAWIDLNGKLEQIKIQDDKLPNPPKELGELVSTYRRGFYQVLSVSNDVVDFLNGATKDPKIIEKDRDEFEEGLRMLREVKSKLKPQESSI